MSKILLSRGLYIEALFDIYDFICHLKFLHKCSKYGRDFTVKKIKITYETTGSEDTVIIDLADEEGDSWELKMYDRALKDTRNKKNVVRRTVQEIIDDEFNKPIFRNNRAETRRHISLELLKEDSIDIADQSSKNPYVETSEKLENGRLGRYIRKLNTDQRDLLRLKFERNYSNKKIANIKGVCLSTVYRELDRIIRILRNMIEESEDDDLNI